MQMQINWTYVRALSREPRWTAEAGSGAGQIEALLEAGMFYEDIPLLRTITTKARLVSDYLCEVEMRTNGDGDDPGGRVGSPEKP